MKKTVLSIIGVVVTAGAVYTDTQQTSEPPAVRVASQLDTQIDQDSTRDTFDYFLSGIGEADLDTLRTHFLTYNANQAKAYRHDEALFEQFVQYRAALEALDPGNMNALDIEGLRFLNDLLLQTQREFFSQEEQQLLFGEENLQRQLALRKLELREQTRDQADFLNAWQQELDALPPVMADSYRRSSLLAQLEHAKSMDPQDQFLTRQALVGPEAAERLAQVSQKRLDFQNRLAQYFEQYDSLQGDFSLSEADRQLAIHTLRESSFSESQWRRVQALESIRQTEQAN
ncbi:lipase secretion chaperone [Photobacterium sp. 1_MG-2023]|uniref:lipase secretion chaperone n=1 Tax=Photobacterium sp. 1_MG-2023 TaxID=3062646 RepID=UPI0026E44DDE|nr:lipase secretion chaperone [Photobacterium sp. 1_MG-2023]MDO6706028.1 lipase secretion chaperone [Photobacterium sp. 1_MG-2023]